MHHTVVCDFLLFLLEVFWNDSDFFIKRLPRESLEGFHINKSSQHTVIIGDRIFDVPDTGYPANEVDKFMSWKQTCF